MVKLSLRLSHDQEAQILTQLTQTRHKGVAMTKCSTRGADYTTKNVECLRCNLVGELKNYTLLVVFCQTKNISLERSPVTLPLPLTAGKWQSCKSKQHSEWVHAVLETGVLGCGAADGIPLQRTGRGTQASLGGAGRNQTGLCCLCRKLCSSCRAFLVHRNSSYRLPWPAWEGRNHLERE